MRFGVVKFRFENPQRTHSTLPVFSFICLAKTTILFQSEKEGECEEKMEDFKERIPMIIAVIIVIGLMIGAYYFLFVHKTQYYTQIDNTKIEELSGNEDMQYQYILTAYTKNGKEKEIQFKTSRELREGAYLELDVMSIRGVIDWREVQQEELPNDVKTAMNIE